MKTKVLEEITKKESPFEHVKAINLGNKEYFNDTTEPSYISFLINRSFSYFKETILIANWLNTNNGLDKKLQSDYYINTVVPKKRFSPWHKIDNTNLEIVQKYFKLNKEKAKETLLLLSVDDLNEIKKLMNPET